ncbi:hypothetical protein ACI2JW_04420 [Serratia ureilytica]|uniref:hypothetical protein n=1 Tax=Serratia ureilytica TaxID=300181 RepID=UPI0038511E6F
MDKLREEFEEKLSHDYGDDALLKNSDGDYVDWLTADLWDYWQASRASIVVDIPNELRIETIVDKKVQQAFVNGHLLGRKECSDAIRSIGLSIKGE